MFSKKPSAESLPSKSFLTSKFVAGSLFITIIVLGLFFTSQTNIFRQISKSNQQVLGAVEDTTKSLELENASPLQAKNLIQEKKSDKNFVILDVRTEKERRDSGYIAGSVHIDYYDPGFEGQLQALDKQKTYLVYSKTDNRSTQVGKMMIEKKFTKVYNLLGGMVAWQNADYELEGR